MNSQCRESVVGDRLDNHCTSTAPIAHSAETVAGETTQEEITRSLFTSPDLTDSSKGVNEDTDVEGRHERRPIKNSLDEITRSMNSTKYLDERRLHFVTNKTVEVKVDKQNSSAANVENDNEGDECDSDESSFESTDNDDEVGQVGGDEGADEHPANNDEESEFPQLSIDDVLQKLNDADVIGDYILMEDIQNIGLEDLEKLQKLNRSIPVIKRLLTNTRLTTRDVKNTPIDPDIKSIVSEFLKTNMVGNFIISRVLRENYATFYGWLATHLQYERNAWVVRLKQTLEKYESLRRDNIETHDVVIESANKLGRLLHYCSQSTACPAKGSYVGSDTGNSKNLTLLQPLPVIVNGQPVPENMVEINDHKKFLQKIKQNVMREEGKENVKHFKHSDLVKEDKNYESLNNTTFSQMSGGTDSVRAKLSGLEYESTHDWKDIMLNRIEQLEGMFTSLLSEREDCLNYVGFKSSVSLLEAISTFMNNRNLSDQGRRKEIEQRLGILETENKQLIEEMTSLQNMLKDKQKDALSLQKQLDKLEEMLTSATCAKVNKCVGTDDSELGMNKGVKKQRNQLSEVDKITHVPYRYKMISMRSPAQDRLKEIDKNNLSNGLNEKQIKDTQQRHFQPLKQEIIPKQKVDNTNFLESNIKNERKQYTREKSIIEISEEKLNILKLRAQKLEDSLHEAISSMTTLQKETLDGDSSSTKSDSKLQHVSWTSKRHPRNQYMGTSLQVQGSTPRLAVIRRPRSQHRSRSETLLESEPTSFLTGRSVALNASNPADRSMAQSCLTIKVDTQSKRDYDDHTANKYNNDVNADQGHNDQNISNNDASKMTKVKVISRHRVASNGMVSKCLRCQKLFGAVDNHKMACFYHTKEKERIEHYDQTGKLTRVTLVWMCCHQPQEIEGCCYGQHV